MSNPDISRDRGQGVIGLSRQPLLTPGCIGLCDSFATVSASAPGVWIAKRRKKGKKKPGKPISPYEKAPWTELQLKIWLFQDLVYLRNDYIQAPTSAAKTIIRETRVASVEKQYRYGRQLLRVHATGTRPKSESPAVAAWDRSHNDAHDALIQLQKRLDEVFQTLRRDATDKLGGSELLKERIEARAKEDPYYDKMLTPHPDDVRLIDDYVRRVFGPEKTIPIIGTVIPDTVDELPKRIEVPPELRPYISIQ